MREILIVDDMPENLQVLQLILKQPNYRVRAALSANIALKLVKEHMPHLIITDIKMPGVSGLDLCQQLKQDEKLQHIPVIFVSAQTDTDNIVAAFEVGGVDYITKPYRPAEILARVRTQFTLLDMKQLELSQAVSQRLRQMVVGIAHEINTPLGTGITAMSHLADIVGGLERKFTQQILNANDLEQAFEGGNSCISLTERSLNKVKHCVEALKSISLAERQSQKLTFSLEACVNKALLRLAQAFPNTQFKVKQAIPQLSIYCDEEMLELVFYNMIENAIYHSGKQEFDLSALCAQNHLHVTFYDHGSGLNDIDVEQMLTPFTTTKRGNAGHMGLSAAITANLITSGLKGSLSVTSGPRGVEWSFSVPCTQID
ncbi:response regulator [Pseudoalteromonas fenneropenaei]|uniref:histidine kinase n=1 Tax=Pseudoalteromonas fenneropenaei TaxID=1737459 RepID=A0ABV7CQ05_9GAMM